MKYTEEELKRYALPLTETEENQCKHAIKMVTEALKEIGLKEKEIKNTDDLSTPYEVRMSGYFGDRDYTVKIFLQGSYANNTNVRRHSDVDIAVVQENLFITKYRSGIDNSKYGFKIITPLIPTFKDQVEKVLKKSLEIILKGKINL